MELFIFVNNKKGW